MRTLSQIKADLDRKPRTHLTEESLRAIAIMRDVTAKEQDRKIKEARLDHSRRSS